MVFVGEIPNILYILYEVSHIFVMCYCDGKAPMLSLQDVMRWFAFRKMQILILVNLLRNDEFLEILGFEN